MNTNYYIKEVDMTRTFKEIAGGIKSSSGFAIKHLDRHFIEYTIADKAVVVPREGITIKGKHHVLLDIRQVELKWNKPIVKRLSEEEIESLTKDLKEAYEALGSIVEIDPELTQFGKKQRS